MPNIEESEKDEINTYDSVSKDSPERYVNAYQDASVCVPVEVTPKANSGKITASCWGEPTVSIHEDRCGGKCLFTIIQPICVEVPIEFGADTLIGKPHIQCENGTCCEGKPEENCGIVDSAAPRTAPVELAQEPDPIPVVEKNMVFDEGLEEALDEMFDEVLDEVLDAEIEHEDEFPAEPEPLTASISESAMDQLLYRPKQMQTLYRVVF
jgi:hypothetical protein